MYPNMSVEDYIEERTCEYKGRLYSVRDNGAVYRHQKEGSRPAPLDNVWTFGKKDSSNGYMMIAGLRVHQIVATAFHGVPESPNLVVDHIDNNKCNNRPSNLHWVTRLENALNNPITRAKIEMVCSIEEFIQNPSILRGHEQKHSQFNWMRAVTPAEAKASYEKWLQWAQLSVEERRNIGGEAGEWLYKNPKQGLISEVSSHRKTAASSSWANANKQFYEAHEKHDASLVNFRRWKIALVDRTEESIFPLAPLSTSGGVNVIDKYRNSLLPNADFLISRYYKTIVKEVIYFEKENKLRVLSERTNAQRTPLYIFEIWADNDTIYHRYVGSYGLSKPKLVAEAMHDLSKFNRQEWKYKQNKPQNL